VEVGFEAVERVAIAPRLADRFAGPVDSISFDDSVLDEPIQRPVDVVDDDGGRGDVAGGVEEVLRGDREPSKSLAGRQPPGSRSSV
jgi:hypothetical protein